MHTSNRSHLELDRPLRAAVIGCGRIGCAFDDQKRKDQINSHAGAYQATQGVELAALVDVDAERAAHYAERFSAAAWYDNAATMFDNERIDLVSICTPNHTHRELVEQAVAAGVRGVFCEKPIAESLEAADAIIETCARNKVVLGVNHMRRFERTHQQVREFLQTGGLGKVQQANCYYVGGLANTGAHLFDILRFFFGDAQWVQGWPSVSFAPNPDDPNVDGWIHFKDDIRAAVQACDVRNYVIFEIHILGSKGRLHVTGSGYGLEYEHVADSNKFQGLQELFPANPPFDAGRPREFVQSAVAQMVEAVAFGTPPVCTGLDGRRSLEIIFGMRESAVSDGRRVTLPLAASEVTICSK